MRYLLLFLLHADCNTTESPFHFCRYPTYNYIAFWRHQVRFERQSPAKARTTYPYCGGGARRSPKEDFGGPDHFMQLQAENGPIDLIREGMGLLEALQEGEEAFTEYLDEHWEEFPQMQYWLSIDQLNRKIINQRLKHYAQGNPAWRERGGL